MKQKRGVFFLFLVLSIIILSLNVLALEVRLVEPANGTIETVSNQINFKCKAVQTGSETLTNITLKLIVDGIPYLKSTTNAVDDTIVTIPYFIPANGDYEWNCLAKNSKNEEFLASRNYLLKLNIQINTPPVIIGTIPNQNKNKNPGQWILDLSPYKSDAETPSNLTWSISGVNTSLVSIAIIGDVATFTPITNAIGSDTVTFTLKDAGGLTDTQDIVITIIDTTPPPANNTPPQITPVIPNQNKSMDEVEWTVDLTEYESDAEDSNPTLTWSVTNVNTSLIEAYISDVTNDILMLSVAEEGVKGSTTIKLILKDSGGLTDDQLVNITIYDPASIPQEEETPEETPEEDALLQETLRERERELINSYLPEQKEVTMTNSKIFSVTTKIDEDIKISWYLNGEEQTEHKDKTNFFLSQSLVKDNETYNLTVITSKDSTIDAREWVVTVNLLSTMVSTKITQTQEEITTSATSIKNKFTGAVTAIKEKISSKLGKTSLIILGVIAAVVIFFIVRKNIFTKKQGGSKFKFKKDSSEFKKESSDFGGYKEIKMPKNLP